jgi:protein-tyrosine phosphatase
VISIFKKKYSLADCIPEGYTDIHSHILHGIDDGAKTIEESALLLQGMIDLKFGKCITTPHTNTLFETTTKEVILNRYQDLLQALPELSNQLQLQVASEYLIEPELDLLTKTKSLLTLKDNYVLVETPYINEPLNLLQQIFEIQIAGYIPILAHPERYAYYYEHFERYHELKKSGCLFQLNLLSTVGYYGKKAVDAADYLLKNQLIDFTGSDIHNKKHIEAFHKKLKIKKVHLLIEAMEKNIYFS